MTGLLPNSVRIFVCDYKAREQVGDLQTTASRQLIEKGGGPQRLLEFSEGPNVGLVSSDMEGVREIVLTVDSLAAAERYLRAEHLLGSLEGERITAKIGAGGLGEAHRARDTKLDVALKVLPPAGFWTQSVVRLRWSTNVCMRK